MSSAGGAASSRFIRGERAAVRQWLWSGCCGFIFCSDGTGWPTRRWRKRSTTAMRGRIYGIDLAVDAVPDETTILNFRHWLERHDLRPGSWGRKSARIWRSTVLLMRQGTHVDTTIIAEGSATKDKQKSRDPEMHQTRKGDAWHFSHETAYQYEISASVLVHTVKGTAANKADITQTAALMSRRGGRRLR